MTLVVESASVNDVSVEQKVEEKVGIVPNNVQPAIVHEQKVEEKVEQKGQFQVMNACSARFNRSAILIEKV